MELDLDGVEAPSAVQLGTALLAALALSGITGITLALFYDWSTEAAHEVVASQQGGILGWIWSVHMWAAYLLLALAAVHPARAWIQGRSFEVSLKKWATGAAGLAVLVGAFFSGTILPWDQQGWEALQHVQFGLDPFGVSAFDPDQPAQAPLAWVFYAHAFAVPALLATVVGVHLWRGTQLPVFARRVYRMAKRGARRAWPAAPLVAGLALLYKPFHGPAPKPRLQLTGPDWPFVWMIPVQRSLDSPGLWALPAVLAALALVPLVPGDWSRTSRVATLGIVVATWIGLTLVGFFG